ncbi:MAG: hypothetical protein MN733_05160 [Nitrososphaera sp.]|nr:hypothetical protein [Nitrososphaera sp.]
MFSTSSAYAADLPISGLPAATAPTGAELLACVQGGVTKKCTATQVVELVKPVVTYGVGLWYTPFPQSNNGGTSITPGADTIICQRGAILEKLTTTNAAIRINTAHAANNAQVAMYKDGSGRPGDLIVATGNISTASTGNVSAAWTAAKQVGPGGSDGGQNIWTCANTSSSTAVFTSAEQGAGNWGMYLIGAASATSILATSSTGLTGIACAGASCNGGSSTFGTWPSSLAGSTWTDRTSETIPLFWFDVTSKP